MLVKSEVLSSNERQSSYCKPAVERSNHRYVDELQKVPIDGHEAVTNARKDALNSYCFSS